MTKEQAFESFVDTVRKLKRGCYCEHDYRCGNCDAVVTLQQTLCRYEAAIGIPGSPSEEGPSDH